MGELRVPLIREGREEDDTKMVTVAYIVDETFANADGDTKRKLRRKLRTKKNDELNHLITLIEMRRFDDARTYILNILGSRPQ